MTETLNPAYGRHALPVPVDRETLSIPFGHACSSVYLEWKTWSAKQTEQ